jgi:CRISPR-associated protein Cmr5
MSNRTDIEQKRAKAAFEMADKKFEKNVLKLPAMIRTNGVANAILFAKTGTGEWKTLYKKLSKYFKDERKIYEEGELMDYILNADDSQLKALTNEIIAFLNWLRRFVKS